MVKVLGHPAEPVEDDSTHGGFAEIARRLNAFHPERSRPISRQLVHRWFECKGSNRFPEPQLVEINGKPRSAYDLDEVQRWYVDRERERVKARQLILARARKRAESMSQAIETIPLFRVDHRGHPIDTEQSAHRGHPVMREGYQGSILDFQ